MRQLETAIIFDFGQIRYSTKFRPPQVRNLENWMKEMSQSHCGKTPRRKSHYPLKSSASVSNHTTYSYNVVGHPKHNILLNRMETWRCHPKHNILPVGSFGDTRSEKFLLFEIVSFGCSADQEYCTLCDSVNRNVIQLDTSLCSISIRYQTLFR